MTTKGDEVLKAAPSLPASERAEIAGALIDRLDVAHDPDATSAWDVEIERRMAQIDSGEVTPVPWLEVRDRLGRSDR